MKDTAYKRIFKALGTVGSISVPVCTDYEGIYAVVKRVMDIEDTMSAFKPDSDVSRINANAGKDFVPVSADTMLLLKRSQYFSEISEGAFDITAAPLVGLWGVGKKQRYIPGEAEIQQTKSLVGYRDLILDEAGGRAMLARRGQSIDLGGIAKGYAADEARRILHEHGTQNALVNLGGNIWAMGQKNGLQPWRIGVQHPLEPTSVAMGDLLIEDKTVVTSGSYEKYFWHNGLRVHHILDPRSGKPADTGLLGVSVVGDCSMDMDALATAVFVLGPEKGIRLLQRLNAQGVFIDDGCNVYVTKELQEKFRLAPKKAAGQQGGA